LRVCAVENRRQRSSDWLGGGESTAGVVDQESRVVQSRWGATSLRSATRRTDRTRGSRIDPPLAVDAYHEASSTILAARRQTSRGPVAQKMSWRRPRRCPTCGVSRRRLPARSKVYVGRQQCPVMEADAVQTTAVQPVGAGGFCYGHRVHAGALISRRRTARPKTISTSRWLEGFRCRRPTDRHRT